MVRHLRLTKIILLIFFISICIFLFSGCGAEIDTVFTLNNKTSGERIIKATIAQSDIDSYVKSGTGGIDQVIKNHIPDDMTYTHSKEGTNLIFTFSISFSNIDEYRSKTATILNANSNNTIKPQIIIDISDNEFKTGILLTENFTSADLLGWLITRLKSEKIINYDDDASWITLRSNQVKYNKQIYNCGYFLSVNQVEDNSLDLVDVKTIINTDGTFERTIDFIISKENEKAIAAKGKDTYKIISSKTPENADIKSTSDEYGSIITITLNASDENSLIESTNKIMSTDNCEFSLQYKASEKGFGVFEVEITDFIDPSYYLNFGNNVSKAKIGYHINGAQLSDDEDFFQISSNKNDVKYFTKTLNSAEKNTSTFSVPLSFDEAELTVSGVNKYKANLKLTSYNSTYEQNKKRVAIESAINSISVDNYNDYSMAAEETKDMVTYNINFKSASPENLTLAISQFIELYSGNPDKFSINTKNIISASSMQNALSLSINTDFSVFSHGSTIFNYQPGLFSRVLPEQTSNNLINAQHSYIQTEPIHFNAVITSINPLGFSLLLTAIIILAVIIILSVKRIRLIALYFSQLPKVKQITEKNIFGLTKNKNKEDIIEVESYILTDSLKTSNSNINVYTVIEPEEENEDSSETEINKNQ